MELGSEENVDIETPISSNPNEACPAIIKPHISVCLYKECLKNHAASIGALVMDGCGEFMPSSEEELKCAACGCHRNFHRKELDDPNIKIHKYHLNHSVIPPFKLPPQAATPVMAFGGTSTDSSSEELNVFQANGGAFATAPPPFALSKKRFRTKFSAEQKAKMLEFAEKIEWRIGKHDEQVVRQFCAQVGVKRRALKVWIHNQKQAMKRKDSTFRYIEREKESETL